MSFCFSHTVSVSIFFTVSTSFPFRVPQLAGRSPPVSREWRIGPLVIHTVSCRKYSNRLLDMSLPLVVFSHGNTVLVQRTS
jgi:hypothetical protein